MLEVDRETGRKTWEIGTKVLVGEFEIDFESCCLIHSETKEVTKLEPLTMELLCFLVANNGDYVNQKELLIHVWDGRYVSDNAIRRVVKKLRDALKDNPKSPKFIKTVPNKGYMLIAAVTPLSESTTDEQPSNDTLSVPDESSPGVSFNRGTLFKLAGFATLLVTGIIFYLFKPGIDQSSWQTTYVNDLPGEQNWADIDPKGKRIVFSSRESSSDHYNLYVSDLNNQTIKRLTSVEANDMSANWANDGQSIIFQRQSGSSSKIMEIQLDELMAVKSVTMLFEYSTLQPNVSLGSDSNLIYFSYQLKKDHPFSIFSLDSKTKELDQITFPSVDGVGDYYSQISPDGKYMAVLRNVQYKRVNLLIIDLESGNALSNNFVKGLPISLAWNHDQSGVYFVSDSKIFLLERESGQISEQPQTDSLAISKIMVQCGENCLLGSSLNSNSRDILEEVIPFSDVQPSSTNSLFLPEKELLPFYGENPEVIFFVSDTNGKQSLHKRSIDGSISKIIQFEKDVILNNLSLSPKGDKILGLLNYQVFTLDLSTNAVSFISKGVENALRPNWCRTGESIYYSRKEARNRVLIQYDLTTGKSKKLKAGILEARESKNKNELFLLSVSGTLFKATKGELDDLLPVTTLPFNSNSSWHLWNNGVLFSKPDGTSFSLNYFDFDKKEVITTNWLENAFHGRFSVSEEKATLLRSKDTPPSENLIMIQPVNQVLAFN